MDPINQLLTENKPLCFSIFINVHTRLRLLEMNKGEITWSDILENVQQNAELSSIEPEDCMAYAGIIYEVATLPKMGSSGPALFIKPEMIGNDEHYLRSILSNLETRSFGADEPLAEILNLKKSMEKFLKKSFSSNTQNITLPESHNSNNNNNNIQSNINNNNSRREFRDREELDNDFFELASIESGGGGGSGGFGGPQQQQHRMMNPSSSSEVRESGPLTKFLAYLRYRGMDMLFPQESHDKVRMDLHFLSFRSFLLISLFFPSSSSVI
jgi:hypothetical protein